jgi:hypothetical protein
MINQQHPIIPSSELLDKLCKDLTLLNLRDIATQAVQWGSDQELEACCAEMNDWGNIHHSCGLNLSNFLRAARRPKPPSLKAQALLVIDTAVNDYRMSSDAASIIRRALEALDD